MTKLALRKYSILQIHWRCRSSACQQKLHEAKLQEERVDESIRRLPQCRLFITLPTATTVGCSISLVFYSVIFIAMPPLNYGG